MINRRDRPFEETPHKPDITVPTMKDLAVEAKWIKTARRRSIGGARTTGQRVDGVRRSLPVAHSRTPQRHNFSGVVSVQRGCNTPGDRL
jgi:hypothetical protein